MRRRASGAGLGDGVGGGVSDGDAEGVGDDVDVDVGVGSPNTKPRIQAEWPLDAGEPPVEFKIKEAAIPEKKMRSNNNPSEHGRSWIGSVHAETSDTA